jgi:hypothetical protein
MKTMTIDEFCGEPEGSFKKFIEKQEQELREQEEWRKARIRAARQKKDFTGGKG